MLHIPVSFYSVVLRPQNYCQCAQWNTNTFPFGLVVSSWLE